MKLEEMKTKNYYEILGVTQEAKAEEIRNAYARAVAKYHPDINPGVENAEIMKLCRKAYATLKDEALKKQYDASLKAKSVEPKAPTNYYAILGVKPDATQEDIKKAFAKAVVDNEVNGKSAEEMKKIKEAYSILSDEAKRAEYDKTLGNKTPVALQSSPKISNLEVKKPKTWFQKHKGKLITTGLVIAGIVVGSLIGAHWNNRSSEPTSITSTTETPDPTPTTKEEVEEKITAENIDEKVDEIVKENEEKGFTIDSEMVRAALFITNVDHMEPQDIYDIFAHQLDGVEDNETRMMIISEEIQKMYNYVSAVRTHNNNGGEYISMVNLAYDKEDVAVLQELDTEYRDLAADLKSGEITETEYQASFKYVTDFYTGKGYLNTKGTEYSNYSMTAGGGLLSEAYWPMFAVAYRSSELETKENAIDIKTLSEGTKDSDAVVNGSKYLGSIVGAINNCTTYLTPEEPEAEPTLTK